MDDLFQPHLAGKKLGDRHSHRVVKDGLPGFAARTESIASERGTCSPPVRYGFRSFDRHWIIPDNRVINRPNPELWEVRSDQQVYLAALSRTSPTTGPAITLTGLVPDLDQYNGRGGRIFPLWRDRAASEPNMPPKLLPFLAEKFGTKVRAEDLIAYIAAVAANPAFTARFQDDLSTPGLRIPVTADAKLFSEASELGRTIIWLHTFGERMVDAKRGRPAQPPRLPAAKRPTIPAKGAIPSDPATMPDTIDYDASKRRLLVGQGYVDNVDVAVWNYEVSGKQVLVQWFSYRKANRERPIIGDRRKPSSLGDIQQGYWLAEYTTELINVLNVLGMLVENEPVQADLLKRTCAGALISSDDLRAAGALEKPVEPKRRAKKNDGPELFSTEDAE